MESFNLYEIRETVSSIPDHVGYSVGTDKSDAIKTYERNHPKCNWLSVCIENGHVTAQKVEIEGFKITVEPLEKKVAESTNPLDRFRFCTDNK